MREGKKYFIKFKDGESQTVLKEVGKTEKSGTEITFQPSKKHLV